MTDNKDRQNKFKLGDRISPVRDIEMNDGRMYFQGKTYEVTDSNLIDINENPENYFKIHIDTGK